VQALEFLTQLVEAGVTPHYATEMIFFSDPSLPFANIYALDTVLILRICLDRRCQLALSSDC